MFQKEATPEIIHGMHIIYPANQSIPLIVLLFPICGRHVIER